MRATYKDRTPKDHAPADAEDTAETREDVAVAEFDRARNKIGRIKPRLPPIGAKRRDHPRSSTR
jgi:hypothetical protein